MFALCPESLVVSWSSVGQDKTPSASPVLTCGRRHGVNWIVMCHTTGDCRENQGVLPANTSLRHSASRELDYTTRKKARSRSGRRNQYTVAVPKCPVPYKVIWANGRTVSDGPNRSTASRRRRLVWPLPEYFAESPPDRPSHADRYRSPRTEIRHRFPEWRDYRAGSAS